MLLDSGLGIDCSASAGYVGSDASASGDAGFHEYTLTLGMGYDITDMIAVSAAIGYTDAIDDDVLPDVEAGGTKPPALLLTPRYCPNIRSGLSFAVTEAIYCILLPRFFGTDECFSADYQKAAREIHRNFLALFPGCRPRFP